MKLIATCFIFLSLQISAQINCSFNYYNKKGGHYLFSTYFESDLQTKKEDTCESFVNGLLWEKRVFRDGHLVEETLNYEGAKKRIRYKLDENPNDTIISLFSEYQENGNLKMEWIFYYNKDKRRCQKTIDYFENGKRRFVNHRAWIKETEIDQYMKANYPPHTIDDEGYTTLSVPIGVEESYYENGKLLSRYYNKFIISEYASDQSKEGPFTQYYDTGQLHIKGKYKNGKAQGKFLNYHITGAISEEKYFINDVSVGTWKGWHPNGKQWYLQVYDSLASNPFQPSLEKYWNDKGILVKESILDRSGNGKEKFWYEDGTPMFEEDLKMYQRYSGIKKEWYANGILKRYYNKSAKADTAVIENYESGTHKFLSINTFNGLVQEHKQWEWFPSGVLKMELTQKTGDTSNLTSIKNYFPSGILSDHREIEGNQIKEEKYHANGIKTRLAFYKDGKLEGNFQLFDSLGTLIVNMNYQNGLRHGVCKAYDSKGNLLFANKYMEGCSDEMYETAIPLKNRLINEVSPGLRDSIYSIAIEMLQYDLMRLEPKKEMVNKATINSTAQHLLWLHDAWTENKCPLPFPFTQQMIKAPAFRFILPASEYKGIDSCDFRNLKTARLKQVFDSLGWNFPSVWTKEGNNFVAMFENGNLYSYHFLYKVFMPWYNLGQIEYNYAQMIENDFGLKNRINTTPKLHLNSTLNSPCVNGFDLYGHGFGGGFPFFLVYEDASVEIYNYIKTWSELEPAEIVYEIGWD